MPERYWLETLGCPKNQVDSDKLAGTLVDGGLAPAASPEEADVVVVNTCAFIEAARQESIDTILALSDARRDGARLVVTGCMAERYQSELADALPEVDLVAPFGTSLTGVPPVARPDVPASLGQWAGGAAADPAQLPATATPVQFVTKTRTGPRAASPGATAARPAAEPGTAGTSPTADPSTIGLLPSFDLLNLPRPATAAPWAYVKVAEGCDRNCGFCAIPSFRGKQRSRSVDSILAEVDQLGTGSSLQEVVLVAQDLASFALDRATRHRTPSGAGHAGGGTGATTGSGVVDVLDSPATGGGTTGGGRPIVDLVAAVSARVPWTRLLYLYPSALDDALVDAVLATGVPYFDLSLQHVSRPLLRRMRRWGDGQRFLDRIAAIRRAEPTAAFRSSFIVGYPGETEADHDQLLAWLDAAQLDWVGFFPYSAEDGTFAAGLGDQVPGGLVTERLRELTELQDAVTARRRDELIGTRIEVLVDAPGQGRSYREAPEIDGIVHVPDHLAVGSFVDVVVTGAAGPDLYAEVPR